MKTISNLIWIYVKGNHFQVDRFYKMTITLYIKLFSLGHLYETAFYAVNSNETIVELTNYFVEQNAVWDATLVFATRYNYL